MSVNPLINPIIILKMETFLFDDTFLDNDKLNELKKVIDYDNLNNNFITSHFYNNENKSLVVNKHIRSSEKVQFKDDKIFDWYEQNVVSKLNQNYDHLYFVLLRDDLEMIRYRVGDFFKKHMDTINYYSNEFLSYTCIINLQPCKQGGETIVYVNEEENRFPECGQKEGSLLIFQKQLLHEGAIVEEGEKIILVANIVVFDKTKQLDKDVLIVTIENTKQSYVIPVKDLEKFNESVYYLYYKFEKSKTPSCSIFRYTEAQLTNNEFMVFYNLIYPQNTKNSLQVLDYIGVKKSNVYSDFNNFVNGIKENSKDKYISEKQLKENNLFLCHINDYYHLLKMIDNDDIIPFQLITFETDSRNNYYNYGNKTQNIVVWFGIYDNMFVTCDYYPYYFYPNDYDEDNENKNVKSNEIESAMSNVVNYGPGHFDVNTGRKSNSKTIYHLNEIMLELNGFRKMSDITFSKYDDPYVQMNKYVVNIMKHIESHQCGGDEMSCRGNHNTKHIKLDPLYKLHDHEKISDCYNKKINVDQLKELNWLQLLNELKRICALSDIRKSNTSVSLTCNSAQYTIFDVVYKFGFVRKSALQKREKCNLDLHISEIVKHYKKGDSFDNDDKQDYQDDKFKNELKLFDFDDYTKKQDFREYAFGVDNDNDNDNDNSDDDNNN